MLASLLQLSHICNLKICLNRLHFSQNFNKRKETSMTKIFGSCIMDRIIVKAPPLSSSLREDSTYHKIFFIDLHIYTSHTEY
eukprot:c30265_g1_i1 orf=124-369(-)